MLIALAGCNDDLAADANQEGAAGAADRSVWIASGSGSALMPLPEAPPELDARRVALGRALFSDRRLSGDGLVTCRDCHLLELGGSNGQQRSALPNRPPVPVNVPTVFNVAYDFRYAWNGRFETIEQQIDFALEAKSAMANSWGKVTAALAGDRALQTAFRNAYPAGLNDTNVRDALASYTRSLVTPNSRFDRSLRAELALAADEQRGYEHFRDYGCVSCHQGVNIGGNLYERFGVMRDYFADRGAVEPADMGRYNATKLERDRHVFRVPSLRNVALTAPYFHDGSALTLPDAIAKMGRYQLGRELDASDVAEIAAFLRALTGELDGRPL